jgi:cyclopropane fatty-acyl-phospholipid synthase-like methyltransferase
LPKKILFGSVSFVCLLFVLNACAIPVWTDGEVPFVPTPVEVVDRMLEMARVTSADVVYDLGSGDGAIIIRAAQKFGARGVGIEIDADLVRKAQANASRGKVEHLTEFRVQDALSADVSQATVITLYMLPEFNAKLRPILDRQLKPGARVISHDFPVEGWVPDRAERIKGDFFHDHTILLFEIR